MSTTLLSPSKTSPTTPRRHTEQDARTAINHGGYPLSLSTRVSNVEFENEKLSMSRRMSRKHHS